MSGRLRIGIGLSALVVGLAACGLPGGGGPFETDPVTVTEPTTVTGSVGGLDTSDTVVMDLVVVGGALGVECSGDVTVVVAPSTPLTCNDTLFAAVPDGSTITVTASAPLTSYTLSFVD